MTLVNIAKDSFWGDTCRELKAAGGSPGLVDMTR